MRYNLAYDSISLSFSIGCLPLLFLSSLPSKKLWFFLAIILIFFCIWRSYCRKKHILIISFLLIGFLWATHSASEYLASIENYIDKKMTVLATVESINIEKSINTDNDKHHYIRFNIKQIDQQSLSKPLKISLLWKYTTIPSAGEEWQLKIKTKVTHSYLNEGSFDSQRFAIANRLLLMGSIEEAHLLKKNKNIRQKIVDTALPYINLFEYSDIMLALAFGERSKLTQDHKLLMFQTGIAHLMAISGMHILLVAFLGNRLMRCLQFFLPIRFISYWFPLLVGVGLATFYAWLSGLNPPAMRAILALFLWLFFRYRNMQLTSWQMINRIVAILLFFDPLMILSESFWLSCYAVICLIFISQWFSAFKVKKNKIKGYISQLIYLQLILTILLLPIQLFIFNGTSGVSIIANLVAIPVISFITFPAILMTLLMSLFDCFYLTIWFGTIADQSLYWLFVILQSMSSYWLDSPHVFYLLSGIGWFFLIIWRVSVWRKYPISLFLVLLIMLTPIFKQKQEVWRIDMLDVGHGLAVVIRKGDSAILYDTGAKWINSSAAERIIIPFLKWHNLKVDGIIISHEHNDHIGGLELIQQYYPDAWLMSSSKRLHNDYQCVSGNELNWHNLQLSILWPEKLKHFSFNPESCVVKISDGLFSILLTGDLEKEQEEKLVLKYRKTLFSTVLQIPHHGSNTSSFYAFLAHTNPTVSLGSVARYNPWKLPSDKALNRYRDLNINYYLTRSSGQISVFIYPDNWLIQTMRSEIKPRWYHDWFGAFPNYG